jgi:hypothetical protein
MASLQFRLSALITKIKTDFDAATSRITTLENASGGGSDTNNIDGGSSATIYTDAQSINGGTA